MVGDRCSKPIRNEHAIIFVYMHCTDNVNRVYIYSISVEPHNLSDKVMIAHI
jgi:hypothetical protein